MAVSGLLVLVKLWARGQLVRALNFFVNWAVKLLQLDKGIKSHVNVFSVFRWND